MERGLVFNVQRYSIQDGPGIRTTVFLKGCPLNCLWCHNPESQASDPEVTVIESRCVRCGECWRVCPASGGSSGEEPWRPAAARCERCGRCVEACPTGARQMIGRWMTVSEVVDQLRKDRVFYDDSGGGATFSGGEPLLQPQFLQEALTACRREGIHTAVDTCGYGSLDALLALAPLTDLFLYDLKIMDDDRHRRYTGVSNAGILDNLLRLGRVHENIWLRLPIVPGLTDGEDQLRAAATWAAAAPGVRRVCLLPFHALGARKARRPVWPAEEGEPASPSPERLRRLAAPFFEAGLDVRTGG